MIEIRPEEIISEDVINRALRPEKLDDYIGQEQLKAKLQIAIEASNERNEPVPHILLTGGPGLGKTTIANIVANESSGDIISVMAPGIKSVADILELVRKVEVNGIIFIDEIHRLERKIEEILYSAMEDYSVTIKTGNKDVLKVKTNPFCLIGATTLPGNMSDPMRERFDIHYTMEFYNPEELATIITANAIKLDMKINGAEPITNIANRSRGIPRTANRLLKRVRDYAQVKNNNIIENQIVNEAMNLESIDEIGLTQADRKYLNSLFSTFNGGPVGGETISASIQEDKKTVEQVIEPFLMRKNFIVKTKQGRLLTTDGLNYITENE